MIITPSIAYGCIDLLESISSSSDYNQTNVNSIELTHANPREVLNILIKIGWIEIEVSGKFSVSLRGKEISEMQSRIEIKTREFLLDFVNVVRPPWLYLVPYGRTPALQHAPTEVRQIFNECGLTKGTESDVIEFWDILAGRIRGRRNARLSDIGRHGELLTFEYEHIRTGNLPTWMAIEDSRVGYDLLSIVSRDNSSPLRVEVKTSTQSIRHARFHVTENEWNTATNIGSHKFYLWWLLGNRKFLAILDSEEIEKHIPKNRGSGKWKDTRIPFWRFIRDFQCLEV